MENLIVRKGEILIDSRLVAERFNKKHKHVLEKIDSLKNDIKYLVVENSATKFIESSNNYRGREFRFVLLNKTAYRLLVMSFTGKKALIWKIEFEKTFDKMEKSLLNQKNVEWLRAREQGKQLRLEYTDTIKKFVDYATSQGSKNAQHYYANFTKMEYKALKLIEKNEKVSKDFRNTLDILELNQLYLAESIAEHELELGIENELHYKEIYQIAKQKVIEFANTVNFKKIEK